MPPVETIPFRYDVAVIGGAGHVGLPLALVLADTELRTLIYDIDAEKVASIAAGQMPFRETGAEPLLERGLASGRLTTTTSPTQLGECRYLIMVIGTPVDEHQNPRFSEIQRTVERCAAHFRDGQTLILRSTVYPGVSQQLQSFFEQRQLRIRVAFCPERVAQGNSIREFRTLPQIISAFDLETLADVERLFLRFAPECVVLEPLEAELCKLMTNSWRYIQFATANQFYMIAEQHGVDFQRVLHGCRHHYPRMVDVPGPGLAAGPCLVKDAMQLAAFSRNNFPLGHAAMLINEGLPAFLIEQAQRACDLSRATVGILGMAFKAESDDPRDSLSYKLRKLLSLSAERVLCTDPYVTDERLQPLEQVLDQADVLFVGTPHEIYRTVQPRADQRVFDVWNILPSSTLTARSEPSA